jgi:hypothetical protein
MLNHSRGKELDNFHDSQVIFQRMSMVVHSSMCSDALIAMVSICAVGEDGGRER